VVPKRMQLPASFFSHLCICAYVPQILAKNVFRQGPRTLIHIGDKDIDYDPEFRLYLATSIANPHFLPEVSVQVCSAPLCCAKHCACKP
jgi:hypothetical protein